MKRVEEDQCREIIKNCQLEWGALCEVVRVLEEQVASITHSGKLRINLTSMSAELLLEKLPASILYPCFFNQPSVCSRLSELHDNRLFMKL